MRIKYDFVRTANKIVFFWKGRGSEIQINDYFPTLMLSGWEEIQPTINKRAAVALSGATVMNSTSQDDG